VRILHLTTFLQGGAGRAIVTLAARQQRAGHEVTVAASRTGAPGYGNYESYIRQLACAGVVVLLVDSMFARDHAATLNVVQALDCFIPPGCEPDVIHAHAAVPSLVGLTFAGTRRAPTAIVQTMHGWGIAKTAGQAAADVAALSLVDAITVPSRHAQQQLESLGVPGDRIRVIDYGIDDRVGPLTASDEPVVSRLREARGRGALAVICVGTLGPRKNQALLIRAIAELRGRCDVFAAIVGDGPAEPLIEAIDRLGVSGAVEIFGFTPAARALVREADALVLPSRNEGQPLAVLEAFADGVPVIVSDTPELQELVRAGETGLHFAAGDAASLAAALELFAGTPADCRSRMGRNGRALYRARFTADGMVAGYEGVYRSLSRPGSRFRVQGSRAGFRVRRFRVPGSQVPGSVSRGRQSRDS